MDRLLFELPNEEREKDALEYINEFHEYGSKINGTGGLDSTEYYKWIKKCLDSMNGINVPENRVPASTYFVVREEDNRIVGMVNIRHKLSEFLITHGYGHIGYSVRPTERRKGYATEILRLSLLECKERDIKEVHVGCYKDNVGSYKTIEKNGGKLYREFQDDESKWNLEYVIEL